VLSKEKKTYVRGSDLYKPENDGVLMNAIWPMPAYIVISNDGNNINALPICGGYLKSVPPRSVIPIPKDSIAYDNIKRSSEFVVSIPDRDHMINFERLEKNPDDVTAAGFSLLKPNVGSVPAIAECPVSQDCKTAAFWDVPGTEYAILMGWQVGITLNREIEIKYNPDLNSYHDRNTYLNQLYSKYFFAVMDRSMVRKWGFLDVNNLTVRGHPSWGSRYHGGWWGLGLDYWLIELCDEGLITRREYFKIKYAIEQWNNAMGKNTIPFIADYYTDEMKRDLRESLTTIFRMMVWAYRNLDKWDQVHEYLGKFPEAHLDFHFGPIHTEKWWERKV
jgi:flavin reductase (DIM6/NTAB) family NADH-FMN oxidoreductase RutF